MLKNREMFPSLGFPRTIVDLSGQRETSIVGCHVRVIHSTRHYDAFFHEIGRQQDRQVRAAVKADLYLFFVDGNNTLTLATGSTVGRGCWGRSSSSRRGSGANPSALRTSRTPVGLSGHWRSLRAWLIS
jgi:hypothetical protein